MALPGDVTTATVTFGPYTDVAGAVLTGIKGKLFPVNPATGKRINLVHVATGQAVLPEALPVLIGDDGTDMVGPIPHTDNATLSTVGFAYRVEWDLPSSPRIPSPGNKTFAVPTAAGASVDFDLLDVADAVPGVLVPMGTGPQGETGPEGPQGEQGLPGTAVDATTLTKGGLRLAGDLSGTADSPTVPALATKVDTGDSRLSDQRVPTNGSVTNAKVAVGAAIDADKLTDGTTNKLLTAAERTKLAGVATGATANSTDASLLARANHTGTQSAATITGLATVATSGAKADVGLGNVDNTTDANKPVSTATQTALNGKASLAGDTFIGGVKVATLAVGSSTLGLKRQPNHSNLVIDGSTLNATGATGIDKVGQGNVVTFQGGFAGEGGYGASNPGYLFGANDFIVTGTAAGAVAGITSIWGRLSETHLKTPSASVTDVFGLAGQANIDATATGATISGWHASIYANGPVNNASATVANAASLYTLSPAAGSATNVYNIYAGGTAQNFYGGQCIYNAGMIVNGSSGSTRFNATTPNTQAAAAGVYLGVTSGSPGIELANGTDNIRLDNNGSALFRILKAGVTSQFEIDTNGHAKHRGGIGLFNTTPITAKRTSSANATDLATALTLLNEIKADLQAIGVKA